MYYVSMTDSFLSGWGMAEGKTNKLVFVCDSYEQAEIVAQNAESRSDMKYVNICVGKPRYNPMRSLTQYKTIEDAPNWYQSGYFKNKQKQG